MFKVDYFRVDQNLMYLIQNVTKQSTADILCYFNNLALNIAEDYVSRHPTKRINKTLAWHYKDSFIPYKLEVYTWYNEEINKNTLRKLYITVNFPIKRDCIDAAKMMDSIVEYGLNLDGSEQLPNFEKPFTRVPAGFKKLLHE
jgi:hypothetical protein